LRGEQPAASASAASSAPIVGKDLRIGLSLVGPGLLPADHGEMAEKLDHTCVYGGRSGGSLI
jgi:hypothetical protein